MRIFQAFLKGFWFVIASPIPLVLKWMLNLVMALAMSWPMLHRMPSWLQDLKVDDPHLLQNAFWLAQASFLEGSVPFLLLMLVIYGLGNLFLNGAALGQYAAAAGSDPAKFWESGQRLFPVLCLHVLIFLGLLLVWLWFCLLRQALPPSHFLDPLQGYFWLFWLGLAFIIYTYEVTRLQIGLEAERQRQQGQKLGMGNILKAPVVWSIGALQGLLTVFAKPGLWLIWALIWLVDLLVFTYFGKSAIESEGFTVLLAGQMVLLLRLLLDLGFYGAGAAYLLQKQTHSFVSEEEHQL